MADLSSFSSLSLKTHIGEAKSGELLVKKLSGDLLNLLANHQLDGQVNNHRNALDLLDESTAIQQYEQTRNTLLTNKKNNNRRNTATDLFNISNIGGLTPNQQKNQAIRFCLGEEIPTAGGSSVGKSAVGAVAGFGAAIKGVITGSNAADSREYEDIISKEVLASPICDICVVQYNEPIPDGFYRISKSPSNKSANLNSGSGGNKIFLCIKKDMTGQLAPITNLIVIFPDRGEYVPPGYHVVHRGKQACNVNTGTSSERIYICFKRDFLGNPIVDLQPIFPTKGEEIPQGFFMIDRSATGVQGNLNMGSGGIDVFLCYRQELTRLQCLLNEPLVSSPEEPAKRTGRYRRDSSDDNLVGRGRSKSPVRNRTSVTPSSVVHIRHRSTDGATSPFAGGEGGEFAVVGIQESRSESPLPHFPSDGGDIRSRTDTFASLGEEEVASLVDETNTTTDFYDECSHDVHGPELVQLRKSQEVVDATGNSVPAPSRKVLHAILSSVYIRQGIFGELAVAGLTKLLKDTDFFEHDLKTTSIAGTITMFDLTIEVICDRFDLAAESEHERIMTFLKTAIKHSAAKMSPPSLQRMFRTISHICNCYSTKSGWMTSGYQMPCNDPGQDVTPFKVLKHFVWDMVAQSESADVAHFLPYSGFIEYHDFDTDLVSQSYLDVRDLVEDLVEETMDSVSTARLCESAFQMITKQAANSSHFWQSMNGIAKKLFVDGSLRSAFVILCAIITQALQPVRTTNNNEPIPRDLGSKLVALEAINEYCLSAGEKLRMSKIMGYAIRRIVVPCLLHNVAYALNDHRVFAKVFKIISALWKKWRRHIRIEFAVLCENFVFKVLQASFFQIRPIYQMIAIQEVTNWFDQPYMLIEMFVNYDMDRKFVSHWNTFSYLVRSMCSISRQLTVVTGAWDWKPTGGNAGNANNTASEDSTKITVTIRDVHLEALEEVCRIAKTLMDASGHAYLMIQDSAFRNRSAGWGDDDEPGSPVRGQAKTFPTATSEDAGSETSSVGDPDSPAAKDAKTEPEKAPKRGTSRVGSIKLRRAAHQEAEELINKAVQIYTEKSSLKKAVQFLVSKEFMPDTPQEIANFLRVYKNSFDPTAIGDFLGEGGVTVEEEEYWSQIRFRYTRAVSFAEKDIEAALRLYLTGCGFRLPGEAQKINRFVEVFVKAFWQDNSGTTFCPFRHPDTLHLLSYAIIMLNTDLHRANIDTKRKSKKMTREEFINNLRGADQGQDIAKEVLGRIYDSIAGQAIELAYDNKTNATTPQEDSRIFHTLLSNATHRNIFSTGSGPGNPVNGAAGQQQKDQQSTHTPLNYVPKDDGVAITASASGTATTSSSSSNSTNARAIQDRRLVEEKSFKNNVKQSLGDAEDLMRSLSSFCYRFQITNVDVKMSQDLVSYMYETVWFHFYNIVESIFAHVEKHTVDVNVRFLALDILCYSLTSAIFLDLKVERMAFAGLLKKFREKCEAMPHVVNTIAGNSQAPNRQIPDDSWYNAVSTNSMETISKLHHLMVHLKDTIQESINYEITRQVAGKFEKKTKVLENNTFFVREGDLQKLHQQGGSQTYRFFLFSDQLIYAHWNRREYVSHCALTLNDLVVLDVDDVKQCSFFIQHPQKQFVAVAESPAVKQQWLKDINQAIIHCKKRESMKDVANEGPKNRRMSIIDRIEDQHNMQLIEQNASIAYDSSVASPSAITVSGVTTNTIVMPRRHSYRHHTQLAGGTLIDNHPIPVAHTPEVMKISFDVGESSDKSAPYQAVPFSLEEPTVGSTDAADGPESPTIELPSNVVPTPEERAAKQQENVLVFQDMVKTLSDKSLNSLFAAVRM